MTFDTAHQVSTLEPGAMGTTDKGDVKQQNIAVGPVAAFEANAARLGLAGREPVGGHLDRVVERVAALRCHGIGTGTAHPLFDAPRNEGR